MFNVEPNGFSYFCLFALKVIRFATVFEVKGCSTTTVTPVKGAWTHVVMLSTALASDGYAVKLNKAEENAFSVYASGLYTFI